MSNMDMSSACLLLPPPCRSQSLFPVVNTNISPFHVHLAYVVPTHCVTSDAYVDCVCGVYLCACQNNLK